MISTEDLSNTTNSQAPSSKSSKDDAERIHSGLLTLIFTNMQDGQLERLVKDAIVNLTKDKSEVARHRKEYLRRVIPQTKGMRPFQNRVGEKLIVKYIVQHVRNDSYLKDVVLNHWLRQHQGWEKLLTTTAPDIFNAEIHRNHEELLQSGATIFDLPEQLKETCEQNKIAIEDLALFLRFRAYGLRHQYQMHAAPIPALNQAVDKAEAVNQHKISNEVRQESVISQLEEMFESLVRTPTDFGNWEQAAALIQKMHMVVEEKREAGQFHFVLLEELNKLHLVWKAEMSYFEFEYHHWSPPSSIDLQPAELLDKLSRFNLLLAESQQLRTKKPENRAQEKTIHQRQNQLEDALISLYDELNHILGQQIILEYEAPSDRREVDHLELETAPTDPPTGSIDSLSTNETTIETFSAPKDSSESKSDQIIDGLLEVQPLELIPSDGAQVVGDNSDSWTATFEATIISETLESDLNDLGSSEAKYSEVHTAEPSPAQSEPLIDPKPVTEQSPSPILSSLRTLPLTRDAAREALTESTLDAWTDLVWALIGDGDLSAAWWLTHTLPDIGQQQPIEEWQIAALIGAHGAITKPENFGWSVLEEITDKRPSDDQVSQFISLAIGLRVALTSPEVIMAAGKELWLTTKLAPFQPLTKLISDFIKDSHYYPVRIEDMLILAHEGEDDVELKEVAKQVGKYIEESRNRHSLSGDAARLWLFLLSEKSDLGGALSRAAKDQRLDYEEVLRVVRIWTNEETVVEQISRTSQQIKSRNQVINITGKARKQLLEQIAKAIEVITVWTKRIEFQRQSRQMPDYIRPAFREFRQQAGKLLVDCRKEITRILDESRDGKLWAAAKTFNYCLADLMWLLGLADQGAGIFLAGDSLSEVQNLSLLKYTECTILDDQNLDPRCRAQIPSSVAQAIVEQRTPEIALTRWIDHQDYRFIERAIELLIPTGAEQEKVKIQVSQSIKASRAALGNFLQRIRVDIDESWMNGQISEEKRGDLMAEISGLEPESVMNFPEAYRQLDQLTSFIREACQHHLNSLREHWKGLGPKLSLRIGNERADEVIQFVEGAFQECASQPSSRRSRQIAEGFIHLRQVLDGAIEFDQVWLTKDGRRDVLEEFLSQKDRIQGWINMHARDEDWPKMDGSPARPWLRHEGELFRVDQKGARAGRAWLKLKQLAANSTNVVPHIEHIIEFLGLTLSGAKRLTLLRQDRDRKYSHGLVQTEPITTARPIPQFGSRSGQTYEVACFWVNSKFDLLASRLEDVSFQSQTVIVLYLGPLDDAQRRDLRDYCQSRNRTVAVLDETLLLFLLGEQKSRLSSFLQCALPYTLLNPYQPFDHSMAPELFYGREEMVRNLQREGSAAIVYGGRKFGKSALLHYVRQEFGNLQSQSYAWVIDLEWLFHNREQNFMHLWFELRDKFKEVGLLAANITTETPDTIQTHLYKALNQNLAARVLVMFDETDRFLNQEGQEGFPHIRSLQKLAADTNNRFKVIFAGLHSVARFSTLPNQPMAHFGAPLKVGPLDPRAAEQLVVEPLWHLGYRFESTQAVLSLLGHCNYHPGLIQLFCEKLLAYLHQCYDDRQPPYTISSDDVERAYRQGNMRHYIKERFEWTLKLDPRYEAITWAIMLDQSEGDGFYTKGYPAHEIEAMCLRHWSQGFDKLGDKEMDSLLDELCGLGVLVQQIETETWRLLSPNLVRLMGSPENIRSRLRKLASRELELEFDSSVDHYNLYDASSHCSPLTRQEEDEIYSRRPRFATMLLFASPASGLADLPGALARITSPGKPERRGVACCEIDSSVDLGDWYDWLQEFYNSERGSGRLIAWHRVKPDDEQLGDRIQRAVEFCRRRREQERSLRVAFIFDPSATWEWLGRREFRKFEQSQPLQDMIIKWPGRWAEQGIKQRLKREQRLHSATVSEEILTATNGWHLLLETLLERTGKQDDPRPFIQPLLEDLLTTNAPINQAFKASLNITATKSVMRILNFILEHKEVYEEWISPDYLTGEDSIDRETCEHVLEYLKRMRLLDWQADNNQGAVVKVESVTRRILEEQ
jgi:hypothetical protein